MTMAATAIRAPTTPCSRPSEEYLGHGGWRFASLRIVPTVAAPTLPAHLHRQPVLGNGPEHLSGRQPVQANRVSAQHVLAGDLGLGDAQLSVSHQLFQCLTEDVPSVDGAHPVELGHPYAV